MDILLVDDDASVIKVLRRGLVQRGHEIRTAVNGLEASAAAEHRLPDLVISDIRMPEMDGLELLQFLRMRCPGVPCILMTGYDDGSTVPALQLGAYDYIRKPVQLKYLLQCIERVQVRRRLEEQLLQEQPASAPPEGLEIRGRDLEPIADAVESIGRRVSQLEEAWSGAQAEGDGSIASIPPRVEQVRVLLAAIRENLATIDTTIGRWRDAHRNPRPPTNGSSATGKRIRA